MGLLPLKPLNIKETKRPGPDGKARTFDPCVVPADRAKQALMKRKIDESGTKA